MPYTVWYESLDIRGGRTSPNFGKTTTGRKTFESKPEVDNYVQLITNRTLQNGRVMSIAISKQED